MPRVVLGHVATAVIALQHRHVAVACVVVWAWHVCGPGGLGGLGANKPWICAPHLFRTLRLRPVAGAGAEAVGPQPIIYMC